MTHLLKVTDSPAAASTRAQRCQVAVHIALSLRGSERKEAVSEERWDRQKLRGEQILNCKSGYALGLCLMPVGQPFLNDDV